MLGVQRVLDPEPVADLGAYVAAGGGVGLRVALDAGPDAALAVVEASGLRGRGGAGFPTATKWRSVLEYRTPSTPPTVVVNAAEGEPGTFKDRAILRANPYRVLEGALIAATVIGSDEVVVATKERFATEVARLQAAADEIRAAGWAPGVRIDVVQGPHEYLYGEETALLEVVQGRMPFPRIAPPWRRGVDDVGDETADAGGVAMATADAETATPPALVNNVETMANVALVLEHGADWFREVGTDTSPGTIVCTVTGHTNDHGVVEVAMGTPLRQVLQAVGGGPVHGEITAVMSGVANRLIPPSALDTPLTYEAMREIGSGLGTAGFIVIDERADPVAVAQAASRFLAVESCGQCTPCKQDGLRISGALDRLRTTNDDGTALIALTDALGTVEDGARCFLATQHEAVVSSFLELFPDEFRAHQAGSVDPAPQYLIAELVDLVAGRERTTAVIDESHMAKQPDWSYGPEDSGQAPADRFDQREGEGIVDLTEGERQARRRADEAARSPRG